MTIDLHALAEEVRLIALRLESAADCPALRRSA